MTLDIHPGDTVIIDKPSACCGDTKGVGTTFTVAKIAMVDVICTVCWKFENMLAVFANDKDSVQAYRVKKIGGNHG